MGAYFLKLMEYIIELFDVPYAIYMHTKCSSTCIHNVFESLCPFEYKSADNG